jgi:hypothetical protein
MELDEKRYLEQFERLELGPEHFDHVGHLYMAWLHLRHYEVDEACARVCTGIRRLAEKFGALEKFHHTLSEALMRIIAGRMQVCDGDFEAFLCANPDLLEDARGVLGQHYSDQCLALKQARSDWVEPDREPIR